MATTTRRSAPPDPSHFRHSYAKDTAQLMRRLSRMEGQVRGIARMIEREEYCVDILQQTAAFRAAVDALSILVLEDHVQGCVRTAAERGEADQYVDEVVDVVRRTLGRPVRSGARTSLAVRYLRRRRRVPSGDVARTHRGTTIVGYAGALHARTDSRSAPVARTDDRAAAPVRRPAPPVATRGDQLADEERRLLAVTLDILASAQPAEARLAGVLDLLARIVGAERAAVLADGDERRVAVAASGPDDTPAAVDLATWLDVAAPRSRARRAAEAPADVVVAIRTGRPPRGDRPPAATPHHAWLPIRRRAP